MFSPDCRFLRIGAQLFALDDQGAYVSMPGLSAQNDAYPAYIEEFASSRSYVFLATRRNITAEDTYQSGIRDGRIKGFGADFTKMEETVMPTFEWSDDEVNDADSESDSSYASSTDSMDRAYETWSECSTDHSEDFQFEDDVITPWAGPAATDGGSLSDSSLSPSVEAEGGSSDDDQTEESGSEDSDLPASAIVGYGQLHSDDEDYGWGGDESHHEEIPTRTWTRKPHDLQVSLAVFDTSCSLPRKIFHFSFMALAMLYASPPVVHPSKALVVWPLGGGDVLFADFVANTYFVRKLMPSTSHSECHQHVAYMSVL